MKICHSNITLLLQNDVPPTPKCCYRSSGVGGLFCIAATSSSCRQNKKGKGKVKGKGKACSWLAAASHPAPRKRRGSHLQRAADGWASGNFLTCHWHVKKHKAIFARKLAKIGLRATAFLPSGTGCGNGDDGRGYRTHFRDSDLFFCLLYSIKM